MARTHSAALRVAPVADITTLTDALRRARRATSAPVTSTYIRNLARDLLSKDRRGGVRQIIALAHDAFTRGAPISDLLDFGYRYLDMVRTWYVRRESGPTASREIPATFAAMHLAEERAEGDRECAETAFAHERSATSALAFLRAREEYQRLETPLVDAARTIAAGGTMHEWGGTKTARRVASAGGHSEAGTHPGPRNLTAARTATTEATNTATNNARHA